MSNIADERRKALVRKLMGQGRGIGVPMPGSAAGAEGGSFHGVGRFGGLPRASTTHMSNIAASVLAKLGAGLNPGLDSEVSPGNGQAIGQPNRPGVPPHPPFAPPIPPPNPPGVVPRAPTGPVTPAGGSSEAISTPDSSSPTNPIGAPGSSGGVSQPASHLPGGIPTTPSTLVPLGNGMFYDPTTDTFVGPGSSAGGGAASRL